MLDSDLTIEVLNNVAETLNKGFSNGKNYFANLLVYKYKTGEVRVVTSVDGLPVETPVSVELEALKEFKKVRTQAEGVLVHQDLQHGWYRGMILSEENEGSLEVLKDLQERGEEALDDIIRMY